MANGDTFVTGFNGTFIEAQRYYVGTPYVYSDETTTQIVKVENLSK